MTTVLKIQGMTCQKCVSRVGKALMMVPGVDSVEVDLNAALAVVQGQDGAEPDLETLVQAVQSAGYSAQRGTE